MIDKIDDFTPAIVERCRESVVFYAQKMLGLSPYYYQLGFLDDPYRFKVATFSRQLGKTFCLAVKASHKINMFPDKRVGIMAHNEKRAFEIYRMVKWLQFRNPILAYNLDKRNDKMSEMILNTGGRVSYYAAGSEGSSIRGETLDHLLLDEGDYIKEEVWTAALPTVSATGGAIDTTSTPRIAGSMFHSIFMDAYNARQKYEGKMELDFGEEPYKEPLGREYEFAAYHFDYTHGLAVTNSFTNLPQIDIKVVNILKKKDYARFEREYLAWWSVDGTTFYNVTNIYNSLVKSSYFYRGKPYAGYRVLGVDFGKVNDYTAFVVNQLSDSKDQGVIIASKHFRDNDWDKVFQAILDYAVEWRIDEIVFDKNNVGDVMKTWFKLLSSKTLPFMVTPITMSGVRKAELYNNSKMHIDAGNIKIHQSHVELIREMQLLTKSVSLNNYLKIHAPEGADNHDDLADAFMLSCAPMVNPEVEEESIASSIIHENFFMNSEYSNDDTYSAIIGDFDMGTDFFDGFDIKPDFDF